MTDSARGPSPDSTSFDAWYSSQFQSEVQSAQRECGNGATTPGDDGEAAHNLSIENQVLKDELKRRCDRIAALLQQVDDLRAEAQSARQREQKRAFDVALLQQQVQELREGTGGAGSVSGGILGGGDTDSSKRTQELQRLRAENASLERLVSRFQDELARRPAAGKGLTADSVPGNPGGTGGTGSIRVEEVWENQRQYPGGSWSSRTLPGERPAFSDGSGNIEMSPPKDIDAHLGVDVATRGQAPQQVRAARAEKKPLSQGRGSDDGSVAEIGDTPPTAAASEAVAAQTHGGGHCANDEDEEVARTVATDNTSMGTPASASQPAVASAPRPSSTEPIEDAISSENGTADNGRNQAGALPEWVPIEPWHIESLADDQGEGYGGAEDVAEGVGLGGASGEQGWSYSTTFGNLTLGRGRARPRFIDVCRRRVWRRRSVRQSHGIDSGRGGDESDAGSGPGSGGASASDRRLSAMAGQLNAAREEARALRAAALRQHEQLRVSVERADAAEQRGIVEARLRAEADSRTAKAETSERAAREAEEAAHAAALALSPMPPPAVVTRPELLTPTKQQSGERDTHLAAVQSPCDSETAAAAALFAASSESLLAGLAVTPSSAAGDNSNGSDFDAGGDANGGRDSSNGASGEPTPGAGPSGGPGRITDADTAPPPVRPLGVDVTKL